MTYDLVIIQHTEITVRIQDEMFALRTYYTVILERTRRAAPLPPRNEGCAASRVWGAEQLPITVIRSCALPYLVSISHLSVIVKLSSAMYFTVPSSALL